MKDDVLKSAATAGRLDSFRVNYQAHLRVTGSGFMIHSERLTQARTYPLESTKRSRLNHFGLFGLALKKLSKPFDERMARGTMTIN